MTLVEAVPSTLTPTCMPMPLASALVPERSMPMKFPDTVLAEAPPVSRTPAWSFPEMMFRAAAFGPPIALASPRISTPASVLPTSSVPETSVPIWLSWTALPNAPSPMFTPLVFPEMTFPPIVFPEDDNQDAVAVSERRRAVGSRADPVTLDDVDVAALQHDAAAQLAADDEAADHAVACVDHQPVRACRRLGAVQLDDGPVDDPARLRAPVDRDRIGNRRQAGGEDLPHSGTRDVEGDCVVVASVGVRVEDRLTERALAASLVLVTTKIVCPAATTVVDVAELFAA